MKLPKNSTGKFKQIKKNFPPELSQQARFFEVKIKADGSVIYPKDYYNENNQKKFADFKDNAIVMLDIERHKIWRPSYLFLDFDHVLINGEFVNEKVAQFVKNLQTLFPDIYIEYSVSGTGLHAFLKPDFDKFGSLTPAKLYFADSRDKEAPQLELFFKTEGRSCLLTGKKFSKGATIPTNTIDTLENKVDDFLTKTLAEIKAQQDKDSEMKKIAQKKVSAQQQKFEKKNFNSPPEYNHDLAIACALFCNFADLPNDEWLPYFTALANADFSREELRGYCAQSPRYNEKEFNKQYDWALDKPTFGIKTLIGKAQQAGFNVKDFYKNWCLNHPSLATDDFDDLSLTEEEIWQQELFEIDKKITDFTTRRDSAIESLKNVEKFDKDVVLSDDILTAAAFAYLYSTKVFLDFKAAIQNQIKLKGTEKFYRDWEREVKYKAKEIEVEHSKLLAEKNFAQAKIQNISFVAVNSETFPIPDNYRVSDVDGITKIVGEKNIPVCLCPVGIKSKLFNTESKTFQWILNFKSNGKWHDLPAQKASVIFNSHKLIELADYDFPVTSGNSFLLVDYLNYFRNANQNKFPLVHVIPRCGWYEFKNQEFFIDPRRQNNFVTEEGKHVEIIPDSSNVFTKNLTSSGTIEEWAKAYNLTKTSPIARLFVAGSVAPSLLKVLGERNFVLYIYGATTGGKSTALLLGASVVGNSKIVRTFEGSKTGIKSAAVEINHYPFFVDEKQHANAQLKADFTAFIYAMGDTHDKTRADTSGKSIESKEFQNITLATGETLLINDNATGGAFTRLLQIPTPKILLAADTCKNIRDIIKNNYGIIFPKVIDKIFEIGSEKLRELHSEFVNLLQVAYPDILSEYCRYVSILTVADVLLNVVLGSDFETATKDAQTNANKIFPLIPTKAEIDDTEREKDFVLGFISSKAAQFEDSNTYRKNGERIIGDVLGKFDFGKKSVFISTGALKQACKDSGFDDKKIVSDLIEDKFFIAGKIQKGKTKADNNHTVYLNGVKTRCYKIPLQLVQESDQE